MPDDRTPLWVGVFSASFVAQYTARLDEGRPADYDTIAQAAAALADHAVAAYDRSVQVLGEGKG